MPDAMETDILVIGAGAAGLTAALAAHEQGADVVLIEKNDRLGGTAAISGGIADSRNEALTYFRSLSHGDIDDAVLGAFIDEGSRAVQFLDSIDAMKLAVLEGYPDYYLDRPGAKKGGGRALDNDLFDFNALGEGRTRVFANGDVPRMLLRETPLGGGSGIVEPEEMQRRADHDLRGWGQALVGRLLKACLARGIEPKLGIAGRRLIIEDGRAVGLLARRENGLLKIRARKGVIVATGGFEWDEELKQTFLRGPLTAPASPPSNTGDGLKMAMAAGAGLGNMTSAWWMPVLPVSGAEWEGGEPRSMPVLIERTLPHTIMVNRAGKRFCNEANNYSALAGAFHFFDPASYDYPNLPTYLIFDQNYRDRYPLAGLFPGHPTPDWVFEAEDLAALARKIGVDAGGLETTLADFNRHAARAEDPDFGRGESDYDRFYGDRSREGAAATLAPLDRGPYHAVEIEIGALGTHGGAKTDATARILDPDGEPIPGLYGAGNVIACPTGSVYAGAGGTLGPALTFGYIAGRSAARRGNGEPHAPA